MIEPLSFVTAFMLGLLGASHCLVMCGGISAAASMNTQGQRKISLLVLFNFGRIASYATAGAIVSSLGLWLSSSHELAITVMRTFAGLLLILMGFYIARWWMVLTQLERGGQFIWRFLQPLTKKLLPIETPSQALALGALWGWLPCGLIYSSLAWVASYSDPLNGAIAMMCFGLGTFPALISSGIFAQQLANLLRHPRFRQLSAILLMVYGGWTLLAIY